MRLCRPCFTAFAIAVLGAMATGGCNNSDFAGSSKGSQLAKEQGEQTNSTDASDKGGTLGNTDDAKGDVGTGSDPEILTSIDTACPKVDQRILILDMKSGWWAGDGGDLYLKLLGSLVGGCVGKISVEFHHVQNSNNNHTKTVYGQDGSKGGYLQPSAPSVRGRFNLWNLFGGDCGNGNTTMPEFNESDWKKYSQIWLLSGSNSDGTDVCDNDPLWVTMVARIKASGRPVFISAASHYTDHANSLLAALGATRMFQDSAMNDGPFGGFNGPQGSVQIGKHPIFSRVGQLAKSGAGASLSLDQGFEALAKDGSEVVIAATPQTAKQRIVVEGDIARSYAVRSVNGQDMVTYLQNVLVYLAFGKTDD